VAFIASFFLSSTASRRSRGRDEIILLQRFAEFQIALRIVHAPIQCLPDLRDRRRRNMAGNRNILFLIIGALIVAVGVLGYNLYQTKKQPDGLQINVGPNGLKIENK
jgi:hypothetical protein